MKTGENIMDRMTVLFPGQYSNYHQIDPDFQAEYDAASETGLFQPILFNYDEWLSGDKLKIAGNQYNPGKTIYRGWMLKPEQYQQFYQALEGKGIRLLTDPASYENLHIFPNIYPFIKADTSEIMFFEDGKVDIEAVKRKFARFMVKDSVKSVKGTKFPVFFDQTVTQSSFNKSMQIFYKYRGDLLTGGICIKEYLNLKHYNQFTNEYRVFYANHQIISVSRNSKQPSYTAEPPVGLIEKYKHLPSPYYTIDYAELIDGTWKILETGDGSVSGLSPKQDAVRYFSALYYAFKEGGDK